MSSLFFTNTSFSFKNSIKSILSILANDLSIVLYNSLFSNKSIVFFILPSATDNILSLTSFLSKFCLIYSLIISFFSFLKIIFVHL